MFGMTTTCSPQLAKAKKEKVGSLNKSKLVHSESVIGFLIILTVIVYSECLYQKPI